jgi:hypothetical protein
MSKLCVVLRSASLWRTDVRLDSRSLHALILNILRGRPLVMVAAGAGLERLERTQLVMGMRDAYDFANAMMCR